jgi:hypothetical protein
MVWMVLNGVMNENDFEEDGRSLFKGRSSPSVLADKVTKAKKHFSEESRHTVDGRTE